MITNWDTAYANMDHVKDGPSYPPKWMAAAQAYREAMIAKGKARLDLRYGPGERNNADLFLPDETPEGLFVFVHGGYWRAFDKSVWSHLARGCIEAGWAVALPSYTLCPEIRIADITQEISAATTFLAKEVDGPLHLAGHSAGGHLASRMVCTDTTLDEDILARIANVVSISGVHDLRPLMKTQLNKTLRIDRAEAHSESPCLLEPLETTRLTAWVGGGELPEFVRQNDLLANVWTGLSATTRSVHDGTHNHFTVVEGLEDRTSPLVAAILGSDGWL